MSNQQSMSEQVSFTCHSTFRNLVLNETNYSNYNDVKTKVLAHFNAEHSNQTVIKYNFIDNDHGTNNNIRSKLKIISSQSDWVSCFKNFRKSKSVREANRFRQIFLDCLNILEINNSNYSTNKKIETLKNIIKLIESGEGNKIFALKYDLINKLIRILVETKMRKEYEDLVLNTYLTLNAFIKYVAVLSHSISVKTDDGNTINISIVFKNDLKNIESMCIIAYSILLNDNNFQNSIKNKICDAIIEIIAIYSCLTDKKSKIYKLFSKPFAIRLLVYIFENFTHQIFHGLCLICKFLDPTNEPRSILELAKHTCVHKLISLTSDYHTEVKRQALRCLTVLYHMNQGRTLVPDAVFVDVVIVDIIKGVEKQRSPALILKYFEQDDDFRKTRVIQNHPFLTDAMHFMENEEQMLFKALKNRALRKLNCRKLGDRTPAALLGVLSGVESMPEYLNRVRSVQNLLIDALHCLWSFLHYGGGKGIHQKHIEIFKRHGSAILNILYAMVTKEINGYETAQTFAAGCLAQIVYDDLEIRNQLIGQGIIGNIRTKLKAMSQEKLEIDNNGDIKYPYSHFLRLRLELLSILARMVDGIKEHFHFFKILLDILPTNNSYKRLLECRLIGFIMMEIADEVAEELSHLENEPIQLKLLEKMKKVLEIPSLQVFAAIIVMKLVNKTNTRHILLKGGTLDSLVKILTQAEHTEPSNEWTLLCIVNAIKSLLWNGDPLAKKLSLRLNIIEKLHKILAKDLSANLLILVLQCLFVLLHDAISIQIRSVRLLVHKTLISKAKDQTLDVPCRV